jgi:hypothetical protein
MLALLIFPLALEPMIGIRHQASLWSAGYIILALSTAACALVLRAFPDRDRPRIARRDGDVNRARLSAGARWHWVVLSFVPSSLMLGVTTHISTDIAAVPLLWIIPLALYLGTFVLAFSGRRVVSERWLAHLVPVLVCVCLFTMVANARQWWLVPMHLATFFACALACHGELARGRPDVRHLTEFYIWLSFGGMLGGIFNTLVAPTLFTVVLEYPLVLAIAAQMRPTSASSVARSWRVHVATAVAALVVFIGLCSAHVVTANLGLIDAVLGVALLWAVGCLFVTRPEPFGIAALLLAAVIAVGRPLHGGDVLFAARSFFGVHRVVDAPDHSYRLLQNGSTNHGRQNATTADRCEPEGYYDRGGPIGQVFSAAGAGFHDVAVIGLGSGALACYAGSMQRWTFYEIDPIVERIARDARYFSYLKNSAGRVNVSLGDGRLGLQRADSAMYDLIVLDAFSSDAIPVHLLTREAMALYLSRLSGTGVIAVHVSNRYLNLEPVLAAIASEDGLVALGRFDAEIPEADAERGRWPSAWVTLARTRAPIEALATSLGWHALSTAAGVSAWTDDYSNLVRVLRLQ